MRHDALETLLSAEYTKLSDMSGYVRSPIAMHDDGTMIGAYVVDVPGDRVRITDDAQVLFHAMANGVAPNVNRGRQYQAIAEQCGIELSEDGELFIVCDEGMAPYYMARFLEAADRISFLSVSHRQKPTGRFEKTVGDALAAYFSQRVVRRISIPGASGHNLIFPFMLDENSSTPIVIQPVAATEGKLDWGNVYHAVGKFADLKNNRSFNSRRIAVLEAADDDVSQQAKAALSETASVIVYSSPRQLAGALKAA